MGYPKGFNKWVKSYYLAILDWDKLLIPKVFKTCVEKNPKYVIFIATNAYDIGINNRDIILIIQWNLPINFDLIIYHISHAKKKNQ